MTILVAIDGTDRAKETLVLANDLANAYDDPLVVLHVIPRKDYNAHKEALQNIPEFKDFSINQEADSAERFAQRITEETLEDPVKTISFEGRVGDIAEETLAAAQDLDPRYLVVSGRRRSPTGKAVFGDAAQQILLNADCPVVTKMSE